MDALSITYADMILSVNTGTIKGSVSVSKPLYILSVINAIESKALTENKIQPTNKFIRDEFGKLYEQVHNNRKGFMVDFFNRPFFHLGSSPFYHLIWKEGVEAPKSANTPSGKYLRENLLYAKLDDELWDLLQDADSREYLKQNIINRYLTK